MLRVSAAHQALRRMRSQRFSWRPPQPGLRHIRALPCCSAQHVWHTLRLRWFGVAWQRGAVARQHPNVGHVT
ncbi:MAG: hypothetical protein H0X31_01265 [Nostocaceae cyanobacterium]|nr:hypothetical protein [Nostocaceae cyanobacterium]